MLNYLMRMFSWEGRAGRKEFFGFWLMPLGASMLLFLMYQVFGSAPSPDEESFHEIFIIAAFAWITAIIHTLAGMRRLRHIGWPTWLATLFLAPGFVQRIGFLIIILELLLVFMPPLSSKKADEPSYLKPNLIIGLSGFVIIAVIYGSALGYRQIKYQQRKAQRKQEYQDLKNIYYPHGIHTPTEIPADIIVPKELDGGTPVARTKPMPMTIPAPKLTVLAERVSWQNPTRCDAICQQAAVDSTTCKQHLSSDGQARLCIYTRLDRYHGKEYHQLLVNPQHLATEHIVFNDIKRPIFLGHFRDNKLKELFYGSSPDETYFFHLAKEGFVPYFTVSNHLPTLQYADISILLLSPHAWVPVAFDEQGRSSRSSAERDLSTPWDGLKVSNRYL